MKRTFLTLTFFMMLIFISCNTKNDKRETSYKKVIKNQKINTLRTKGTYTYYNDYNFRVKEGFSLYQKEGKRDSLYLEKDVSIEKTIFKYRDNKSFINDSLMYCDHEYALNSEKLKFLSKKTILYNQVKFTISKYLYSPEAELFESNVFINDSLGIIMNNIHGKSSGLLLYKFGHQYIQLQDKIYNDTLFYKFQSSFD